MKTLIAAAVLSFVTPTLASAAEGGAHDHHAGIFLGATKTDHDTAPSFGLEYEYMVNQPSIGIQLVVERTLGDAPFTAALVGPNFHFAEHGRAFVGFGQEQSHGHSETLYRFGLGWALHVGTLSLTPSISYDTVKGHHAIVAGVAVGAGF